MVALDLNYETADPRHVAVQIAAPLAGPAPVPQIVVTPRDTSHPFAVMSRRDLTAPTATRAPGWLSPPSLLAGAWVLGFTIAAVIAAGAAI